MEAKGKNPYICYIPTRGRPKKTLTAAGWKLVETLAQYMATDEEIACALSDDTDKIAVDALTNKLNGPTFAERKEKGQSRGKTSLRTLQFKTAKRGSVPMQIFLGKQWLGQSDNPSGDHLRRETFEYQKGKDAGDNIEIEDLTDVEREIYGDGE